MPAFSTFILSRGTGNKFWLINTLFMSQPTCGTLPVKWKSQRHWSDLGYQPSSRALLISGAQKSQYPPYVFLLNPTRHLCSSLDQKEKLSVSVTEHQLTAASSVPLGSAHESPFQPPMRSSGLVAHSSSSATSTRSVVNEHISTVLGNEFCRLLGAVVSSILHFCGTGTDTFKFAGWPNALLSSRDKGQGPWWLPLPSHRGIVAPTGPRPSQRG